MSTGVAGLYIGRIFVQVRDRPLYVLDDGYGRVDGADDIGDQPGQRER